MLVYHGVTSEIATHLQTSGAALAALQTGQAKRLGVGIPAANHSAGTKV